MNIQTAFPSKYLKVDDLSGRAVKVKMDQVTSEEVGQGNQKEEKPILYFAGKKKGLVLNKTNALAIVDAYGEETDGWVGKEIELFPDKTDFAGKRVACIRVRVAGAAVEREPGEDDGAF